jgi:hypothetical protein
VRLAPGDRSRSDEERIYWRTLDVATEKHGSGVQLVLSGEVIGDTDVLAVPTHVIPPTMEWKKGRFVEVSRKDKRIQAYLVQPDATGRFG